MVKFSNKLNKCDNLVISYNKDNSYIKELGINDKNKQSSGIYTSYDKYDFNALVTIDETKTNKTIDLKKCLNKILKLNGTTYIDVDSFNFKNKEELTEYISMFIVENSFDKELFKNKQNNNNKEYFIFSSKDLSKFIKLGVSLGEGVNSAKRLVTLPHNHLNAIQLADYAKKMSNDNGLEYSELNKKEIEAKKMGLFLAVNAGSKIEPRMIVIKHLNDPSTKDVTALVGKGLTYDTGGYSIKISGFMVNMKTDMGGSAAVLGAMESIAKRNVKANVIAVIPATDNMIGPDAIVPDDVVFASDGTSVEIHSTDAEGRLALADALLYAKELGANKLVDVATLTGSCVAALGSHYTGGMTNNEKFLKEIIEVSKEAGEPIWHLPCDEGHLKDLKSPVADMKNSGPNRGGAMSQAGAFLGHFAGKDTPWVHLDIAGTSCNNDKSATGVMVKTLTKMFEK